MSDSDATTVDQEALPRKDTAKELEALKKSIETVASFVEAELARHDRVEQQLLGTITRLKENGSEEAASWQDRMRGQRASYDRRASAVMGRMAAEAQSAAAYENTRDTRLLAIRAMEFSAVVAEELGRRLQVQKELQGSISQMLLNEAGDGLDIGDLGADLRASYNQRAMEDRREVHRLRLMQERRRSTEELRSKFQDRERTVPASIRRARKQKAYADLDATMEQIRDAKHRASQVTPCI